MGIKMSMLLNTETLPATRSLFVTRRGGQVLRAVIDGRNVYAQVTDSDGTVQYPAWNPIYNEFDMWETTLDSSADTEMFEKAWSNILQHPALRFAAE